MKIGGHVSSAGGVTKAIERAQKIGANCLQIFVSSPRSWAVPEVDKDIASEFKKLLTQNNLTPSFVHNKYLINLASPNPEVRQKSQEALTKELKNVSALGLAGSIFHTGSLKDSQRTDGYQHVVKHSKEILADIPEDVFFLLENAASPKKIGGSLEELASLLKDINHPQAGVCLDTCHAFAAGFDLNDPKQVHKFIDKIDTTIGLKQVKVFHLNDSKGDLNSGIDRHENIGEGKIGLAGFKALLNHPKLAAIPFVLEVPGFNKEGPDAKNIAIVKSLLE